MRLDEPCNLPLGTKDALHVPIVVASARKYMESPNPGDFVRFIDDTFTIVEICNGKNYHGIVNPFHQHDYYDKFIVLLRPGVTRPVFHHFEIDTSKIDEKFNSLEQELEEAKNADPNCADCYYIENGRIVRG